VGLTAEVLPAARAGGRRARHPAPVGSRGPIAGAAFQADVTAAMAVPCWGMLLLCAGFLSRRLLDVRLLAAWDADWQAMGRRGPAGANPGP